MEGCYLVQSFHDIPILPLLLPQIKSLIRLIKEHPQSAESLLNALRCEVCVTCTVVYLASFPPHFLAEIFAVQWNSSNADTIGTMLCAQNIEASIFRRLRYISSRRSNALMLLSVTKPRSKTLPCCTLAGKANPRVVLCIPVLCIPVLL